MKRNFLQLKEFLEHKFPELRGHIHGSNYPPPAYAGLAANFVSFLQASSLLFFFAGDSVWNLVGGAPGWYYDAKKNPVPVLIGCFIFLPTVAQNLSNTGAFEVMLDGVTVFSRIETGAFPNGREISRVLAGMGLAENRGAVE